ncbi:MAG TPA: hypothetical protein VHK06_04985 [Candidatus Limnocylindria bacterium]|nr:hypothetical protein [Candidatus Limnocylindria bacterium]
MRAACLVPFLVLALVALFDPAPLRASEPPSKVAIIVGPVGEELTPVYLALGEEAARRAEEAGAVAARAFSPEASPENVLAAVEGANIVVYLGHGIGFPNPYNDQLDPMVVNGWGLQGPNARGTHEDSSQDGTLAYYGEAWIAANARPAPGWVMIYSNACYAPGAGEGAHPQASPEEAAARVAGYSRAPLAEMGASAYFATDFYAGAAELIGQLLTRPGIAMGDLFASEPRFVADGLARHPHPLVAGAEVWLQRSAYFDGKVDYWYSFAGDPTATFRGGSPAALTAALPGVSPGGAGGLPTSRVAAPSAPSAPPPPIVTPLRGLDGVVVGKASHGQNPGWEGRATVTLPAEIGGAWALPGTRPAAVVVCADRCAAIPVVDACPCDVGTSDQRVANLSDTAWSLVSDAPLEQAIVDVVVYPAGTGPSPPAAAGPPAS